ncbi:hypothetical protein C7212DRAFT_342412 [Tuber magnatum]|uniref:Uncharacterized protein n=1 Tax=Tuber magnatum TaxID=42249 RepID=A0A317SUD9_9PEZI|nr:hypothetical protein C7212DRAFT_342412 [Tuber magnatum]
MSTIPPKYRSNPYRGKHPYSNLWTDLSTYPPIPGATQSLTTPTATPRPLTEPFAHWLPTAPPPSYSHATRNDVEAPGSSTGRKTFVFWASMVAIILAFCWLIYKHIRGAKDGERPPDHDDPQPRAPTPAPQENWLRFLVFSGMPERVLTGEGGEEGEEGEEVLI